MHSPVAAANESRSIFRCPGPWITCKRGLRQGDPLSPYLFLIVADVLQQLVKCNSSLVRHPLVDDAPCPILQYADDTLIVARGERQDIHYGSVFKKGKLGSA
jgi:hypothetical protein